MLNRIDAKFASLAAKDERALITYIMAGDPFPSVHQTADLIVTLAEAGADIIELGIPYSDPMADGPSIQAASQRALDASVTATFALDVVRMVRLRSEIPIVLMGYYNTVLRRGLDSFAANMAEVGADGVILVDLPPEESAPWKTAADRNSLATIFLLAPTSTDERIASVANGMSSGFIYCVSRTGVTGARQDVPVDLAALISRIEQYTTLPVCVGFGVSSVVHVKQIAAVCDGVVIGSVLVDFLKKHASDDAWKSKVTHLVSGWKSGTLTE